MPISTSSTPGAFAPAVWLCRSLWVGTPVHSLGVVTGPNHWVVSLLFTPANGTNPWTLGTFRL